MASVCQMLTFVASFVTGKQPPNFQNENWRRYVRYVLQAHCQYKLKKPVWLRVRKDLFIDSASSVTHRWPIAWSADDKRIPAQRSRAIFIPVERLDW